MAIIVFALVAAAFFVGRRSGETRASGHTVVLTGKPTGSAGFALLRTRKCRTTIGSYLSPVPLGTTTRAAIPSTEAGGLTAYRDATGTTLVAPAEWECEAGIGADGNEHVVAYPPGHADFTEVPYPPGEVVSLEVIPACRGCIAGAICALFPMAKVVREAAQLEGPCRDEKPLREQVTHVSKTTVVFVDPPHVRGTGVGSGGQVPSMGALSFSEASGVRKVSCALRQQFANVCAGIVGATMLATPLY